jgi:hypothetical protein
MLVRDQARFLTEARVGHTRHLDTQIERLLLREPRGTDYLGVNTNRIMLGGVRHADRLARRTRRVLLECVRIVVGQRLFDRLSV